jgi:hypothetical protein
MLLQATTGPRDENGVGVGVAPSQHPPPGGVSVNGGSPLDYVPVSRQRSSRRGDRDRDRRNESMLVHSPENMYPQSTSHHGMEGHGSYHHDHNASAPGTSYRRIGGGEANGSGGETREFQTHIFAPPVTGAPTKKSKFSGQGGFFYCRCSIFGSMVLVFSFRLVDVIVDNRDSLLSYFRISASILN